MASVKIKTTGPLFQSTAPAVLDAGIRAGLEKLLPRVEATVRLKTPGAGTYRRTILGKVKGTGSGFGVVASTDPRKLRTWLETGKRRGVKTARKGAYAWRAGKTMAKNENKAGYFEEEIAKRLNG